MTGLHVTSHASGTLLPVHAQPGSRRNAITGIHDGRLKVTVTAAPEKGKANAAIIRLLAAELGLSRSEVSLSSGGTSSRKKFLIAGLTPPQLLQQLAATLKESHGTS